MRRFWTVSAAAVAALAMSGAGFVFPAQAAENTKPTQTLNVDYATRTGDFLGGASGTLYGLGDDGSPTDAILNGARVENSSQKPPTGTQHPSGDALALEDQFFASGGNELAVYMQDYYPDWSYHGGARPGDDRTYVLDVPVDDPSYGTYAEGGDGVWDYAQITEIVVNKILANTEHPDNYTFIPFNEPDGGNWYASDDNADAAIFQTFLEDWDCEYALVQSIWEQYRSGEKPNVHGVAPTLDHATVAGPGDCVWRQNRSDRFLQHTKDAGTLPDVFVWHELGRGSLETYRSHYEAYRSLERKYGIDPLRINITEYGELRDMSVPGQLIQWQSMFEDTKVQAETAYWNYAGNLSDNMSRANAANAGWWQFKWYGDLRGQQTVKVASEHPNTQDNLQGIAALDENNRKATVLYGGANDANGDAVRNTGANIPVTVHLTGLDQAGLGGKVDVEVRENAFVGHDGMAAAPRVVNTLSGVDVVDGVLDVTTVSADRYASYQLVVTPHQDRTLVTDADSGKALLVQEAERSELAGGAQSYTKTPSGSGWSYFMASGNGDVGNFKDGGTATWRVDVPADGTYRLQVTSGNQGFPGTNKVTVDGSEAGVLSYNAELAMKDAAKWKYYGSAELELQLTEGTHAITLHGDSSFDNTLDKFLLYQVDSGEGTAQDRTVYPASQLRLDGDAALVYDDDGTNGFAALANGTADAFAHAWNAGYHDVTITYNAPKDSTFTLRVNGADAATITAVYDGLQSSTVRTALSEGINQLTLAATGDVRVREIVTARASEADTEAITVEAENATLGGAAQVTSASRTNASGSYVTGLGNRFETAETGANGFGDRTRVVVKDSNNTPTVHEGDKGTLTIPAGTVPAGTYNVVVRFSNDAFIGRHDYNPQIVDLGLQVRQGGADGAEIARGAFRYTFSDTSFLNRSMAIATDGSALTFGNWDEAGTGVGAVSWGVAPNLDSLTFYPVTTGEVSSCADANTLTGIEAEATTAKVNVGASTSDLGLQVTARYAGEQTEAKILTEGQYQVDFDSSTAGERTVTITYTEGRVTRQATLTVTVTAGEPDPDPEPEPDPDQPTAPTDPSDPSKPGEETKPGDDGKTDDQTKTAAKPGTDNGKGKLSATGVAVIGLGALATVAAGAGLTLDRLRRRR